MLAARSEVTLGGKTNSLPYPYSAASEGGWQAQSRLVSTIRSRH